VQVFVLPCGKAYHIHHERQMIRITTAATSPATTECPHRDALARSLQTVVSIPATPFTEEGAIDEAQYVGLLNRLTGGGVSVVTVNGNTGEYYALSSAERHRLIRLTVDEVPADTTVVVGVGLDVATAVADAKVAADAGAACVMVHHPVHPYRSPQGWVDYHTQIANQVPELRIVPYLKDPVIGPDDIHRLRDACAGLVAVKYAVPDPTRMADLVAAAPELTWLCGLAELWAPFFRVAGSSGFTSGLVTIDPARSFRMLAALDKDDMGAAMTEWREVRTFEHLRARRGSELNVSAVKEALAQLQLCGRWVRPPISELTTPERAEVTAILAGWGLSAERVRS
jgi:4-hydroxy-tetrahydrodipicolinate synthase